MPFAVPITAHTTTRVAGPTEVAAVIARAATDAARALLSRGADATTSKRTAEHEATRAWAQEQRLRFGQVEEYCTGTLSLALAERRNDPEYRTRMPMWQKVIYTADVLGMDTAQSAEAIGVDESVVIATLPIAREIHRECVERLGG